MDRQSGDSGDSDDSGHLASVAKADFDTLERMAHSCRRCRLSESRTQVVFGVGKRDADLMLIGEAPGFHEDKQGEPFVGAAGRLLTTLLEEAGIERSSVYIANVLKCRPPGNRDPNDDEVNSCEPYLFRQMELVNPFVIATLGNFATKSILARSVGISRLRGQVFPYKGGAVVIPTYHPAALLRGTSPTRLEEAKSDMKLISETLQKMRQRALEGALRDATEASSAQLETASQLELF
jgi:uracil-DNA glycosylase family 4